MSKTSEKEKRQKCRMFADQNGRCHYCGCFMVLTFEHVVPQPDNLATVEHLYDRFNPERGKRPAGERCRVLACHKCNHEKGKESQKKYIEQVRGAIMRVGIDPTELGINLLESRNCK